LTNPTEPATFRLDKAMLDQLRQEAEEKRINLSTLLNQIIESHIKWHASATKAGFMPIRKIVIKKLFDSLTIENIDALATEVSLGLTDETMAIMSSKRSEKSVFELIDRWIKMSGFSYHHEVSENSHIYVVHHNMGEKWSYYLSRIFDHIALEFMNTKPDTQTTENALFIKIRRA
jgi:hypothetical protein